MAHRVISLKYRPQNFDELTGQSHVVLSLKGAINSERIGHAFLFAGPRGVGKTTTARILAKSLNCITGSTIHPCQECPSCQEITSSRSIDVVEIDGASNRGIDEIRNLREAVQYSPLYCRHKIYIIDEVHMLTPEAFNALLKTLEEPPPSVIFIFATTNLTKIPATILSRCQRFVFKRLSLKEITARLRTIAEKEKMEVTDNALHYVAIRADGSIRDAESILEQLMSFIEGKITEEDVFKLVGFLSVDFYFDLLKKILAKDLASAILSLNQGIEEGADLIEIYRGLTSYLRAALLIKTGITEEFVELNIEEITTLKTMDLSKEKIISLLDICLRCEEMIRRSANVRIAIELLISQLVLNLPDSEAKPVNNNTAVNSTTQTINIKEKVFAALQNNSPKLAGIIHKAEVKKDGNNIIIAVDNEFSKQQLLNSREILEAALKNVLNAYYTLNVQLAKEPKEEEGLAKTLKVMFDSEEVR